MRYLEKSFFCLLLLALCGLSTNIVSAADFEVRFLRWSGEGIFIPANVGKAGAPGDGIIIGDGSGLAPYPGPRGNNFRLNGILQPPIDDTGDTDRHYGVVHTVTSGSLQADGSIVWMGRDAQVGLANPPKDILPPAGENAQIHITQTAIGNVYFKKRGFVLLSPDGTDLTCYWWFHIIGGTGEFDGAKGWLFATAENLEPIPPDFDPADGAPFAYEFWGFVHVRVD